LWEADQYSQEAATSLFWLPAVKGTRGTVLFELGRVDEATPLLWDALQMDDVPIQTAQSACWLAIVEARRGDLRAGQKYLAKARKFDPTCYLLDRAEKALHSAKAAQHVSGFL
jgi:hypothetical protein